MNRKDRALDSRPGAGCSIVVTAQVRRYTRRLSVTEKRRARRRAVCTVLACFVTLTLVAWDDRHGLVGSVVTGVQATSLLGIAGFCAWLFDDWQQWRQLPPV